MRKIAIVLALVLVAGSLNAQYEKAEARVRKALAAGKAYKAIGYCERVLIKKDPPARFLVLRADAYNRVGEFEKAMRDARQAQAVLGDDPELRSQLVGAHLGLGQPDSALQYFGNSREAGPTLVEEFAFRMGTTYQRLGSWHDALAIFEEGVRSFPSSARMVRERGSCHAMLGDSVMARIDLEQAVSLAPRDPVAHNSLGYYGYALFGDHARSVVEFDKAIKQDPNYGYAFSNRGWSQYKLGNTEKARKDLNLAARKNKGNAYVYRNLGIIDLETGRKEEACVNFRKALERKFTANYGGEVEELVRTHCDAGVLPLPDKAASPIPPPTNAPGAAPQKGNAP